MEFIYGIPYRRKKRKKCIYVRYAGIAVDSGKASLNIKYTGGSGKATYSSKNIRGNPTKGSEGRGNVTVEKEKEDKE